VAGNDRLLAQGLRIADAKDTQERSSGPMKFSCVTVASVLALAAAAWLSEGTASLAKPKVPLPRPRPTLVAGGAPAAATPAALHSKPPASPAAALAAPSPDLAAVKQALELVRRGKTGEATSVEAGIHDPAAKRLVEWAILRSDENNVGFDRYVAFIAANPGWPSEIGRAHV